MAEARKYLLERISHRGIVKLINSYGDRLTLSDESYYLSVNKTLKTEYNKVINAYVLLFLRVQDVVSGNKSASVKSDAMASYKIVNNGLLLTKNYLDPYVTREPLTDRSDVIIYRTRDLTIGKALAILEKKILIRFGALLSNGTISDDEYKASVEAYNNFVLHLTIYRNYGKSSLAKERALTAIRLFIATYQKK